MLVSLPLSVALVLTLAAVRGEQREYCPSMVNVEIQECVQPVADYAKLLNKPENATPTTTNNDLSAFALPTMGRQVFQELCRLIGRFNSCVSEWRQKCPRHVTISLIDSSYGYLCNEGFSIFMESAECLMDLDRKPQVKTCHDETLHEIERANADLGIGINAKLDRMCSALNFFSGCVRPPIRSDCGQSAWQVIFRVLKDTTNTLMPGCQFTGTSPKLKKLFASSSTARSFVVTSPLPSISRPIPPTPAFSSHPLQAIDRSVSLLPSLSLLLLLLLRL